MRTTRRPTVLLETRSGYPYRYRRYASRQSAMHAVARLPAALGSRVRILALPSGEHTWIEPHEPTPIGGRVVATFDGANWSKP